MIKKAEESHHDVNTPHQKSHHSEKLKASLVTRLNRIEGQIRGAKRLIEDDTYCDDVLNLISSIQSALSGVGSILVEHHLKSCVVNKIKQGDADVIDEFMKTIKRFAK